jgi:hypothetical protein
VTEGMKEEKKEERKCRKDVTEGMKEKGMEERK